MRDRPTATVDIDIWTDPVWGPGEFPPYFHDGPPLILPDTHNGHDVSVYRVKIELVAVEVIVQEDPEVLEWVEL